MLRGGIEWCLRGASCVVEIFVRVASTASGGEEAGGGFFCDFERSRTQARTIPKRYTTRTGARRRSSSRKAITIPYVRQSRC